MRNLSQLLVFLLISLIASPIFASKGCDSLKSYVYNASDTTLEVKFEESYNDTADNPATKAMVVKPGQIVLVGVSENGNFEDKRYHARSSMVVSHLQVYAANKPIVNIWAKKLYSNPPKIPLSTPIVFSHSYSEHYEPITPFAISNEVQPGECATWQPGVWILTIQSKAKTPPLP